MSRRIHDQEILRRFPYPVAAAWARLRTMALTDAERVA